MDAEITVMIDGERLVLVLANVGVAQVHVRRGVSLEHLLHRLDDEVRGLGERAKLSADIARTGEA